LVASLEFRSDMLIKEVFNQERLQDITNNINVESLIKEVSEYQSQNPDYWEDRQPSVNSAQSIQSMPNDESMRSIKHEMEEGVINGEDEIDNMDCNNNSNMVSFSNQDGNGVVISF